MFKGLIFDMDGVLVDSMPAHARALVMFCKQFGGAQGWDGDLSRFAGRGPEDIFSELLPKQMEEMGVDALNEEKERLYREIYGPEAELMPSLVEFLEGVKAHGIKCSVGSSGCFENVDMVWTKCSLERWFEARVCANDVTHCKPSPEIFLTAAKWLGLQPEECIVVEDAISGIIAAKAAGMKVVTLTTTLPREQLAEAGADLIIDSFAEINYDVLSKL